MRTTIITLLLTLIFTSCDRSQPPATQPLASGLFSLVDTNIDSIFSPLDTRIPPLPRGDLRALEEEFRDGILKAPASDRPVYELAIDACHALSVAMDEREKQLARLNDSRGKPHNAALGHSMSKDPKIAQIEIDAAKASAARMDKFFEAQIMNDWASAAKPIRQNVELMYARLREAERKRTAALSLATP